MTNRTFTQASAFLVVLVLLFMIQILIRFNSEINHDVAWIFYTAKSIANGKVLYRDIIEVNPPLIFWQCLIIFYVSNFLGFNIEIVFNTVCLLLTALALNLANRYIVLTGIAADSQRRFFITFVATGLLFFPGFNFGQREHLLVLLFLPWLVLRATRIHSLKVSMPEAIVVGALAATGIALKPHSLLAPMAVEAALFFLHRNWRNVFTVENLSASVTIICYIGGIAFLTPEFMFSILELGVRAYIPLYGTGFISVIVLSLPVLGTIIISIVLNIRFDTADKALAVAFISASIGFLISYYIQAKGYLYQILPATVFAATGGAAILFRLSLAETKTVLLRKISLVALLFTIHIHQQFYLSKAPLFEKLITETASSSQTIFIASTNVSKSFPLVNRNNFVWASRFPAQWLTPYVSTKWVSGPIPDDEIVRQALVWVVSDLIEFQPDIVMIDVCNQQNYVPNGFFDYLAFWKLDPRFSRFWKDYNLKSTQYGFAIYTRNSL
jgi:hypothetical protein